MPQWLDNFLENIHTGEYIKMDSFTLWKWKTAWMRSFADRAKKVCSKENVPKHLQLIRKFASWTGYSKNIVIAKETWTNDVNEQKDKIPTVFINMEKKVRIYWKNILRNWDALLAKKLISLVVILSRKYRFSLIRKISWTSLLNLMLFTSSHVLVVNIPVLEKLSKHSSKEQKNM